MLRGFFGNLIFAIIARMLCRNHLNLLNAEFVHRLDLHFSSIVLKPEKVRLVAAGRNHTIVSTGKW